MKMKMGYHFILIDDSELDLFINEKMISISNLALSITRFNSAEDGLSYLEAAKDHLPKSILLLDLQMPVINGFDFVDMFASFDQTIREKISIYILSSTVDKDDIERIKTNPLIIDIFSKPLDIEILEQKLIEDGL